MKSPCELLLYRSKTIPPLLLGFERFEENKPKKLTGLLTVGNSRAPVELKLNVTWWMPRIGSLNNRYFCKISFHNPIRSNSNRIFTNLASTIFILNLLNFIFDLPLDL